MARRTVDRTTTKGPWARRIEGVAVQLLDGQTVHVRAIRPTDAPALAAFHDGLSAASVRNRFFGAHPHLTKDEVTRFAEVDGFHRVALVALVDDGIVGVARYDALADGSSAEVALVVADRYQRRGLGTRLFDLLAAMARAHGFTQLRAQLLTTNTQMLDVFKRCGLPAEFSRDDAVIEVDIDLERGRSAKGERGMCQLASQKNRAE